MKDKKENIMYILIGVCLLFLLKSDAVYTPYFIVLVFSLYCMKHNVHNNSFKVKDNKKYIVLFSLFFAGMIVFSNYNIYAENSIFNMFVLVILFIGCELAFLNIFQYITNTMQLLVWKKNEYLFFLLY